MWIGIPARVCARRPVRPRVARARALDATVAPPVANACARCASIVVVVVVVDCRRRARVEGVSGVVASRRGPSRVGKQCDDATRATVSYVQTVRTRGRSVAVGRRDRDACLDARDAAHDDARPRPRPRRERARARRASDDPSVGRESRIARASRGRSARRARRLDSTPPRDARESDARESDGASARRRSARARDRAASSRDRARRRRRAKRARDARDRATTDGRVVVRAGAHFHES